MPAAVTRDELLQVASKEYDKLRLLVERVDEVLALAKDDDDTSIKDVVAHRAHWIRLFLGWYEDGVAGKKVYFPAEGYKWSELKRYNADLRARQTDLSWSQACADLGDAHTDLIDFIEAHSSDDLYAGPMAGANNEWTPGRWAEAAGPSHYRSASKYVRRRRRDAD
ncbi:MAG: ClbS/DfsB family four-helix bundle protein [Acidimicrobiales bacterium]